MATTIIASAATSQAWDASENQIWLDGSVCGKVLDKLTLKMTEQMRYKNEGDFYYYHHSDVMLTYTMTKNWSIAPGFRHMSSANAKQVWSDKEMYHLNLNHKVSMLGVDLKSRFRLTYTDADKTDYLADVRPEFTLTPSKGFTGWKLMPFLSDEIMYNLNEVHLYRNRASTGLMLSPMKGLSLKLFVMHENTQKTEEGDFNENFNYGVFAGYKF